MNAKPYLLLPENSPALPMNFFDNLAICPKDERYQQGSTKAGGSITAYVAANLT